MTGNRAAAALRARPLAADCTRVREFVSGGRASLFLALLICSAAGRGQAAAPPCAPAGACTGTSAGDWCIETLVPGGSGHPRFNAIWADAPDDVWAVGTRDDGGGF